MAGLLYFIAGWFSCAVVAALVIWRLWNRRSGQLAQMQSSIDDLRAEVAELEEGISTALGADHSQPAPTRRPRLRVIRGRGYLALAALALPEMARRSVDAVRDNPALAAAAAGGIAASVGTLGVYIATPYTSTPPLESLPTPPSAAAPPNETHGPTPPPIQPTQATTTDRPRIVRDDTGTDDNTRDNATPQPDPSPKISDVEVPAATTAPPTPDLPDLTVPDVEEEQPTEQPPTPADDDCDLVCVRLRVVAGSAEPSPARHRRIYAAPVKAAFGVTA